ncbi:MAG: AAA family ATPase [Anaerolineae bacterium]|nr:AAA family ATPase [Anaerolineae bacterium]
MKFPYGNADFYDIITNGYFYVDRTTHIPLIEDAGKALLFLRPRRFGKSLLLSLLENYYDIAKADEFERLFGHLAIGKQPTPKHNQYLILKWNFSVIATQGSITEIKRALHNHLNGCIEMFKDQYRHYLDYEITLDEQDALRSLHSVLVAAKRSQYNIYLLIDEYDNFANEVLMANRDSHQRYEALIQGEGMIKTLFKAVKYGTEGQGIDRVFITGVSPVVMSDVTSGFNIAKDIYLEPEFNDLCGFWEHEIATVTHKIMYSAKSEALSMMQTFYNGYSFAYGKPNALYNPTLALYFWEHLQKRQSFPEEMLDENLAMDRSKLAYIAGLPKGEQLIWDALDQRQALSIQRLANRFGVREVLHTPKDYTFMISLLYYFGILTLGERTTQGKRTLHIPNMVVRGLYLERIQEMMLPDLARDDALNVAEALYSTGAMQPVCDFIEHTYFKVLANRDCRWANELTIKTMFLAVLFNNLFYIMDSEPALQRDYADLVMRVRPDMRQYTLLDILIEFKYVALGQHQLNGEQIRNMDNVTLRALPAVQAAFDNACSKLARYRQTLHDIYGDILCLRSYAVVAVGFERLIWEEMTNAS